MANSVLSVEHFYISAFIYIDDSSRVSLIEISLTPEEFDNYQIGVDTAITFCLKELRVIC